MPLKNSIIVLTLLSIALVVTACGSSPDSANENEIVAKITPSETIFSLESLTDVGFKKGKTFDSR
jgi:hypothetical protein